MELIVYADLRNEQAEPQAARSATRTAVDPVCGMAVEVSDSTPSWQYQGEVYYFCCPGCRRRFARNPQQYLAVADGPGAG